MSPIHPSPPQATFGWLFHFCIQELHAIQQVQDQSPITEEAFQGQ
jgi:hypothetical protein